MFTRVMHIQSRPGKLDEVVAVYKEAVVPALKLQPGFHSTMLLTDAAKQSGMSITIWASEADQQASERAGFLLAQVVKVAHLLAGPPLQESFVATTYAD